MSRQEKDYTKLINKVIDYIQNNLNRNISISELADQIYLSSYHFHRIFTSTVGESVGKFILRKRLEKAGRLLLQSEDSISEIAYACGYSSVSVFCRGFKRLFGMTAEEFRSKNGEEYSKNSQSESMNKQYSSVYSKYFCKVKTIKIGDKIMNCTFEVKELPALNIVYCRHQGSYNAMGPTFAKLIQWAYPRGLVVAPDFKLVSVYLDDPQITPVDKLQSDAGLIVTGDVPVTGEIGKYTIKGGLHAVGRFEIAMSEFGDAWSAMCKLIPDNGCQQIDGHYYEIYLNNQEEHPEKKFIVDICIPVKPA